MAGFYAGVDKKSVKVKSGKRFKDFIKKYLPDRYDSNKLWEDLRCGLVHSYAVPETYVFTDANKMGQHFYKTKDRKILLNLEDFLKEIGNAYKSLRRDILKDKKIFNNAKKRAISMGIMLPTKIK